MNPIQAIIEARFYVAIAIIVIFIIKELVEEYNYRQTIKEAKKNKRMKLD